MISILERRRPIVPTQPAAPQRNVINVNEYEPKGHSDDDDVEEEEVVGDEEEEEESVGDVDEDFDETANWLQIHPYLLVYAATFLQPFWSIVDTSILMSEIGLPVTSLRLPAV